MPLSALWSFGPFRRGVHPADHKAAGASIRRMAFAPRLTLPLSQSVGAPSLPVVRVGQEVVRGELIAEAAGWVSVPLHAPASGVIEAIALRPTARGAWMPSIVLRVFEASTQAVLWRAPADLDALDQKGLVAAVQATGLVGLGGAAFPTHVKLSPPAGSSIHTLVVNGCECEPYLTCDHRVMLERTEELIAGIRLAMRIVGAHHARIGIEDNKPDAIARLREKLVDDAAIEVCAVPARYPQGAEKILIQSLFGIELGAGHLPAEAGIAVNNVGTLAALGRLMPAGEGLIERVITFAGPGIARPGDYWVPLGTPLRFALDQVGAFNPDNPSGRIRHKNPVRGEPVEPQAPFDKLRANGFLANGLSGFKSPGIEEMEVILGGPMMGAPVASLDVPITKGVSGLLVFPRALVAEHDARKTSACIKCGECLRVCPMRLNPSQLGLLAAKGEYEQMEALHLSNCFECGCCAYVCPANLPLVQRFRTAKGILRERATA